MKFSIITCTWNNEKWLQKHIESVRNQSFNDYEHIIIDDASTDSSIEIIKNYVDRSKTKVFVRKQREFPLKNHILGLKQASGDIIIHLDGDDWFYDSGVLQYLFNLYENKKCIATYGSWVDPFNNKNKYPHKQHPTHNPEDVRKFKQWYFTHLRTFKRELASFINGMDLFDVNGDLHQYAADCALLTSIYEQAFKMGTVLFIDKPLVYYNGSINSNEPGPKQHIVFNQIFNSKYTTNNIKSYEK